MKETSAPSIGNAATTFPDQKLGIVAQYIRDLSFESYPAKEGPDGDPENELSLQVHLENSKKGDDNRYEVVTRISATNKSKQTGDTLFILEVEYAGLFKIDGLSDEQLDSYLHIECPRITFPNLRRIVATLTEDGGFPSLVLDTIDFASLYRKELERRAQANLAGTAQPDT